MNYRRGFFRLWLVFSTVWVLVGTLLTDHSYWRELLELAKLKLEAAEKEFRDDPDRSVSVLPSLDIWRATLQERRVLLEAERTYKLHKYLTVLPPVILGAVGFSFIWIKDGFRNAEGGKGDS